MSEPNRCLDCGTPISPLQSRCYACHTDYWLDEVMEGESWDNVPEYGEYGESWDDSEYDDVSDLVDGDD